MDTSYCIMGHVDDDMLLDNDDTHMLDNDDTHMLDNDDMLGFIFN